MVDNTEPGDEPEEPPESDPPSTSPRRGRITPENLGALMRSMDSLVEQFDTKGALSAAADSALSASKEVARLADIPPIPSSWTPGPPAFVPSPEIGLMREQNRAVAEMAGGISELASHARREGRRSTLLIWLTAGVLLLSGAIVGLTVALLNQH